MNDCLKSLRGFKIILYTHSAPRATMSLSLLLSIQSLVINSAARRTCTVGEIVNLVSADTQKLMDFVVYFNAVWLAPIEIVLCLFFLWQVCLNVVFSQCFPFIHDHILTEKPLTLFYLFSPFCLISSILVHLLWQELPRSSLFFH